MNKELIDLAWSVLPKEFKEEVKKLYNRFLFTREGYYDELFGKHNLTSDAEGEVMLMVSRKEVMKHFREANLDRIYHPNDSKDYAQATGRKIMLVRLFGKDKCLPDDKANEKVDENISDENFSKVERLEKNDEPKFKVGDKVVIIANCKHKGEVTEIIHVDKGDPICTYYLHNFSGEWYSEFDLEPYTEPDTSHETPVCENHSDNTSQKEVHMSSNRNLSQNVADCDKQFDNILKDSFRRHNRLHVASMVLQGIMANPNEQMINMNINDTLNLTLRMTDALLNECEEGGKS